MNNKLKDYILFVLIFDYNESVDKEKYERVIKAIDTNYHINDFISYIMRSIESRCVNEKIVPTDNNIRKIINISYCVDRACEYFDFLQNDHECAHDCEIEFSHLR